MVSLLGHPSSWKPLRCLAVSLALAGCASANLTEATIPFSYPGELGVGGGVVSGQVLLDRGQESAEAGSALVEVLQAMHFSIVSPDLLQSTLASGQTFATDTVRLDTRQIADYNHRFGATSPLPTDRIIGLSLQGVFQIHGKAVHLMMRPRIFERGRASPYRAFQNEYVAGYFVDLVRESLITRLHGARTGR